MVSDYPEKVFKSLRETAYTHINDLSRYTTIRSQLTLYSERFDHNCI